MGDRVRLLDPGRVTRSCSKRCRSVACDHVRDLFRDGESLSLVSVRGALRGCWRAVRLRGDATPAIVRVVAGLHQTALPERSSSMSASQPAVEARRPGFRRRVVRPGLRRDGGRGRAVGRPGRRTSDVHDARHIGLHRAQRGHAAHDHRRGADRTPVFAACVKPPKPRHSPLLQNGAERSHLVVELKLPWPVLARCFPPPARASPWLRNGPGEQGMPLERSFRADTVLGPRRDPRGRAGVTISAWRGGYGLSGRGCYLKQV